MDSDIPPARHDTTTHRHAAARRIYGAPLGILMLEARFPRIPGDMGNAATWPFPVLYRVVQGASPERVVLNGAAGLLRRFPRRGRGPGRRRAPRRSPPTAASCRCSSASWRRMCGVPVATSALLQVPWVQATLPPGKRVGVITVSAQSLTPRHLEAAGVPLDTPFVGTEGGREFFRVLILGEKQDMDVGAGRSRTSWTPAGALVARHPDIGAIVLECTNMPPYAHALREVLGLPVYDIYSLITWLHAGLRPRDFGAAA